MAKKHKTKRKRKRLRALQQVWHRGIKPELDRLHRKLDQLVETRRRKLDAQIGFAPPAPESSEDDA
jgi:hypothetical protein